VVRRQQLDRRLPAKPFLVEGHQALFSGGLPRVRGSRRPPQLRGDEVQAPGPIAAACRAATHVCEGVDEEALDELGRQPPLARFPVFSQEEGHIDIPRGEGFAQRFFRGGRHCLGVEHVQVGEHIVQGSGDPGLLRAPAHRAAPVRHRVSPR
jgi:hypothetical protein